uniref:ESF1-like protein n=1 Tax=Noccaea caerulescens TaxID=107243 RepID=A0A1J3DPB6_NOCCA
MATVLNEFDTLYEQFYGSGAIEVEQDMEPAIVEEADPLYERIKKELRSESEEEDRNRPDESEIAMGTTNMPRIPRMIDRMRFGLEFYHPVIPNWVELTDEELFTDPDSDDSDRDEERYQNYFNYFHPNPITIPVRETEGLDDESISGPETRRLSLRVMDWSRVSAKDLLLLFLNPFLPEDGRILSVAVYPEEGYHAVAECDSSATADYLYNKSRHGIESEFERCSNKLLDFRFIPESLEFKQPPRDVATDEPVPDPSFSALVQGVHINQL